MSFPMRMLDSLKKVPITFNRSRCAAGEDPRFHGDFLETNVQKQLQMVCIRQQVDMKSFKVMPRNSYPAIWFQPARNDTDVLNRNLTEKLLA